MSRSYLFVPGNTPGMLQNLTIFEADSVIIDLEDSVVDFDKDAARDLIESFYHKHHPKTVDVYVRINDVNSPFFDNDLAQMNTLPIKGYVLPKATFKTVEYMATVTSKKLITIIESPLAYLDAQAIAQHPQVQGLLLGAEDLTKEMNIQRTKESMEIFHVRSHIALVCHAFQKEAIDTPWTHKDDEEGLYKDALQAKQLGFTGKSSIHPNHVAIINQTFTPSLDDIKQAKRIVKKAQETTKGAFSLDGKMVDLPIIEKAKKTIELAKKYQLI